MNNVMDFVLKEVVQEDNILSRIIKLESRNEQIENRLKILEAEILKERKTNKN